MVDNLRWWDPSNHLDRRPFLIARAEIKTAIRGWFRDREFLEVDTTCLQISPGNEPHIHALSTEILTPDQSRIKRYLHTSPEFAMKKLLAAGERKIFFLGPCFRNQEQGPLHATEFTMLEWYRAEESLDTIMEDTKDLLHLACRTTNQRLISWRGRTANPFSPLERLSLREAFSRYLGIDLLLTLRKGNEGPDRSALALEAERVGITVRPADTWSDIFTRLLAAHIEPKLGLGHGTFLTHYPTIESSLARACSEDPRFAQRFELYCCGVEIANGFEELTDPIQQRENFEKNMSLKYERYGETYPLDEGFLDALKDMPEASGCALGFDRLTMLATGATHINQVLWTPPTYTSY